MLWKLAFGFEEVVADSTWKDETCALQQTYATCRYGETPDMTKFHDVSIGKAMLP